MGPLLVDAKQPVSVRACARAAAAGLDPEQVVEQRDDEVVVQVPPARGAHDERHDRQPFRLQVAQDLDGRLLAPGTDGTPQAVLLVGTHHLHPHGRLQLEYQTGADRLDDGRGAAHLALGRVVEVPVLAGVDVGHGCAGPVHQPHHGAHSPHSRLTFAEGATLARPSKDAGNGI